MNLAIVNRHDPNMSFAKVKQLGANHDFSVVHDDECPFGVVIMVFADCVVYKSLIYPDMEMVIPNV